MDKLTSHRPAKSGSPTTALILAQWISDFSVGVMQMMEQSKEPRDTADAECATGLFLSLFNLLARLDASLSFGAVDSLCGQGGGPVGQFNQQIAEAANVPFARAGFMGTSAVNESALGYVLPLLTRGGDSSPVLMDCAAHTSLIGAMAISGQPIIWLPRDYNPDLDIQMVPSAQRIERLLSRHPAIETVAITSPDYNGNVADVKAIAYVCGRRGAQLYVDSAWGVGCGIIDGYPNNPVALGAVAASVSFHKKGIGLSQTSCLYSRSEAFIKAYDAQALDHNTTSPCYLALGFAQVMHTELTHGALREDWARIPALATRLRARAANIHPKMRVLDSADAGAGASDPSHCVLYLGDIGVSGFDMVEAMQAYGYDCEKGTFKTLLILLSPALFGAEDALIEALRCSVQDCLSAPARAQGCAPAPPVLAAGALTIRDVMRGPKTRIPLAESAGEICAVTIAVYPPGTPILAPGSIIKPAHIDYLSTISNMGGQVSGLNMTAPCPRISVSKRAADIA